ncbi:MAG: DUF2339 domain-containing protein [Lysobacteraceae bacterium]
MHWPLALLGGLIGIGLGASGSALLGGLLGLLFGWQAGRLAELRQRLDRVEQAQRQASMQRMVADGLARATQTQAQPSASPVTPSAPSAAKPPADPPLAQPAAARPPVQTVVDRPADRPAAAAVPESVEPARAAASTTPPASASRPTAPSLLDKARGWLFEGNPLVKLGVLVLFVGAAAALRYASDIWDLRFPIEWRLGLIALLALAGLFWGWRNRLQRPAFGLSLQGGAIGALLLTIFAAYRLYAVLPAGIAFALVVALVAGAAILALAQDAIWLAILGFVGGYLGPVLIATGSGNHVALFGYYAVLNAAVFAIAWLRPWRALNLVGFAFTFGVGTLWGARYFRPELFASVEPFLVLFFLFYIAIAVLYALRGERRGAELVDGALVFGTPLLAFPLQAALLDGDREGLALSALAVAALYGLLAFCLLRGRRAPLLGQSFAALALGFATLAVPLALSARWTSATWAIEGAALIWLGLRQQRGLPQFAGWALQGLAALACLGSLFDGGWSASTGEMAILNGHALGLLLMAAAALLISRLYEDRQRALVWIAFLLGLFWWSLAGLRELIEHFGEHSPGLSVTLFALLTMALATALRALLRWPRLGWAAVGVILLGPALAALAWADLGDTPFSHRHLAWLGWALAALVTLWRLRQPLQRGIGFAHIAWLASVAVFYGLTLHDLAQTQALASGWRFVADWLPILLLLLATIHLPRPATWPLADLFPRYAPIWFTLAGVVLFAAWLHSLGQPGDSAPLPYLPLLNPLELFQAVLLLLAVQALRKQASAQPLAVLVTGAALLMVSFAALRAVHQLGGAPWNVAILDSGMAQASLTVVWIVAGVLAWVLGSRRQHWPTWIVGATLIGIVLAKLLLVDRRYFGDIAGIVSFMAVGGLLVLVGRIAPTPPRRHAGEHIE